MNIGNELYWCPTAEIMKHELQMERHTIKAKKAQENSVKLKSRPRTQAKHTWKVDEKYEKATTHG